MAKHKSPTLQRRHFLRGACGLTLGLPLLDAFMPRGAAAQSATTPAFLLVVVQGNGVVQAGKGLDGTMDPERFWPTTAGALTAAALTADKATRATGELSTHATQLSMVRGLSHPFGATSCAHASGDAQLLTAAKLTGTSSKTLALGESIDSRIARELNPEGREPLVLHAGKYSPGGTGFDIPGYVSYSAANQPRTYLDSPYKAYDRITQVVGTGGSAQPTGPTAEQLRQVDRSKSINDLLRTEIKDLLARTDLSVTDRQRLDQHLSAIRDLEVAMASLPSVPAIPDASVASMKDIDPKPYDMANHEKLIDLHMQLMVFAAASGYTRVAVLKIGDREDDHTFTLDGNTFMYHTASHRAIVNGAALCSLADFAHMRHFNGMLDQLAAITTPTGSLLDAGLTVWTNQVGNGNHSFSNVPWLLAGTAGGFLKTGQFLDVSAKKYQTQHMLNTLLSAAGVRKTGGDPIDNFGDASLAGGVLNELHA
jgi:Protein of unknown function (DUF1552)